jgi:hypothetical protein
VEWRRPVVLIQCVSRGNLPDMRWIRICPLDVFQRFWATFANGSMTMPECAEPRFKTSRATSSRRRRRDARS